MARYRHPKHGYHLAGYGDDIAALKAAGWVLDEPVLVPSPVPVPVPVPQTIPEPNPTDPAVQVGPLPEVSKRRGRRVR
jgi:hypothetical protein